MAHPDVLLRRKTTGRRHWPTPAACTGARGHGRHDEGRNGATTCATNIINHHCSAIPRLASSRSCMRTVPQPRLWSRAWRNADAKPASSSRYLREEGTHTSFPLGDQWRSVMRAVTRHADLWAQFHHCTPTSGAIVRGTDRADFSEVWIARAGWQEPSRLDRLRHAVAVITESMLGAPPWLSRPISKDLGRRAKWWVQDHDPQLEIRHDPMG
jgi:hypothetical protein